MWIRTVFTLGLVALLSGCATLDRDECLAADWYLLGFSDAAAGHGAQRIDDHRSACAEHGVIPILDDYLVGHEQGKRKFCTWEKGYSIGRNGDGLNPICDGDLKYDFHNGYDAGRGVYRQALEVTAQERALEQLREDRRQARLDIVDKENQLLADGLDRNQRYNLLREIDALDDRLDEYEDQIPQRKRQLEEERRYLQLLEQEAQASR